jgi:hypothetical protein
VPVYYVLASLYFMLPLVVFYVRFVFLQSPLTGGYRMTPRYHIFWLVNFSHVGVPRVVKNYSTDYSMEKSLGNTWPSYS